MGFRGKSGRCWSRRWWSRTRTVAVGIPSALTGLGRRGRRYRRSTRIPLRTQRHHPRRRQELPLAGIGNQWCVGVVPSHCVPTDWSGGALSATASTPSVVRPHHVVRDGARCADHHTHGGKRRGRYPPFGGRSEALTGEAEPSGHTGGRFRSHSTSDSTMRVAKPTGETRTPRWAPAPPSKNEPVVV